MNPVNKLVVYFLVAHPTKFHLKIAIWIYHPVELLNGFHDILHSSLSSTNPLFFHQPLNGIVPH